MKNILVTGGSGFLGGHILKNLSSKHWEIHTTCFRHTYEMPKIQWHTCNLTEKEQVEKLFHNCKPGVVIHTAAMTDVRTCEENPSLAERINETATHYVAGLCEKTNCRLVHVSTDMVFDGETGKYSEDNEPRPIHFYGETKRRAEQVVSDTCNNYVVARSALIYGKPYLGGTTFSAWMIEQWTNNNSVSLFDDEYRTPISVTNLSKILIELAEHQFKGTIHCGGKDRLSRYEFGVRVANSIGISEKYIHRCKIKDIVTDIPRPKDLSFNSTNLLLTLKTSLLSTQEGINLEFVENPRRRKNQ